MKYRINWIPKTGNPQVFTNHNVVPVSDKVYDCVARIVGCYDLFKITEDQHMVAANAESWCEIASVGEVYHNYKIAPFSIEVIEDNSPAIP